jgi:NDP-sugar pyrophosphorylase family protein
MLLNFLSQNQVTLPIKNYEISDESDQILNSGGAVAKCEPLLSQEKGFWIFNTDEVIFPLKEEFNLRLLVASHQETNSLATLLVTQNDLVGTKFGGAWANSDNQVMRFSKTSQPGLKGWHYVGLMLLSSKIFQYVSKPTRPENILYDVLTTAISMGERVQVFPESLFWMETGVLEEFKINQQKMQQEIQSQSVIGRLMHERLNRYPKFPDVVG